MSYFHYEIQCEGCKNIFQVAFGVVGTTLLARPPERCPTCNSDKLKNLPMFPRAKGEEVI